MRKVELGNSGVQVSNVSQGLMRIDNKTDQQIRDLYRTAREAGIDFFDHADIYGGVIHDCETRFGGALNLSSSEREEIYIQSKCGIVKDGPYFDFSHDHIIEAVNGSLAALKTDYLDVLLLHRPDSLVQPEEVARAFDELEQSGKVRHFGVSNETPMYIELLKTAVNQPLVANQLQLSVTHSPIIAQGLAVNMVDEDQAIMRDGEVLSYSRIHKMTIQAWSPFQAGFFNGPFIGNPNYKELNDVLDELAARYSVTPEGIAISWITTHPANMQVVLGTTTPERVTAAAAGSDIVLTKPEWYRVFKAADHLIP